MLNNLKVKVKIMKEKVRILKVKWKLLKKQCRNYRSIKYNIGMKKLLGGLYS